MKTIAPLKKRGKIGFSVQCVFNLLFVFLIWNYRKAVFRYAIQLENILCYCYVFVSLSKTVHKNSNDLNAILNDEDQLFENLERIRTNGTENQNHFQNK